MKLHPVNPNDYLASCDIIDVDDAAVRHQAVALRDATQYQSIENCFLFVRDEIKHSSDYELNPVTLTASEVLRHRTGFCYAKSHLLAALLRANGIPTGLCYQRLAVNEDATKFCLHGLNAVFLKEFGWFRVDARGQRDDLHSEFKPRNESLPFSAALKGESDLGDIHRQPLPVIVDCLRRALSWRHVCESLPDVPIDESGA